MTDIEIWLTIFGLALATILTRGMPLLLPGQWVLPARLSIALRYAPMAGLTAILAPDIVLTESSLALHAGNLKLWAVGIAILVWLKWKNAALVLIISGISFVLLNLSAI